MELMSKINWVDVVVITLLLRTAYGSYRNGLTHELLSLAGLILNITISLHFYAKIGSFITDYIVHIPIHVSKFFSFLVLVVIIWLAFKIIRVFLDKAIRVEWSPFIESTFGLVVSTVKASLAVSLVLIILALMPASYMQRSIRDRSLTGLFFLRLGPTVYEKSIRLIPFVKVESGLVDRQVLLDALSSEKSVAVE